MENDELRSIGLLAYDERTETWYLSTRDSHRLVLDRETLERLVSLYNSIHSGSPLHLKDERSLMRLEEANRRMSLTIRDLYLHIDRERRSPPLRLAVDLLAAIRRLLFRRNRRD